MTIDHYKEHEVHDLLIAIKILIKIIIGSSNYQLRIHCEIEKISWQGLKKPSLCTYKTDYNEIRAKI